MAPHVERLAWTDIVIGALDLPKAKLNLTLGLGSGLSRRAGDKPGRVFAITDRGPNLFFSTAIAAYGLTRFEAIKAARDAKIMPAPDFVPEIVELQVDGAAVHLAARKQLRTGGGRVVSGLLTPVGPGEEAEPMFGLDGRRLPADPLGIDAEALAATADGFWIAEEYGPSLLKADANGVVTERWVPTGRESLFAGSGIAIRGVLPAKAAQRRINRGFEGVAASPDGHWLYLVVQSALASADRASVPIWKIDAASSETVAEFAYPLDDPSTFRRDTARRKVGPADLKISELTWAGEDTLIVLERIAHTMKLYLVRLADLPEKRLLLSSDDHPAIGPDIEGVALLSPAELLLVSDNDFGVEDAETGFWRVTLDSEIRA